MTKQKIGTHNSMTYLPLKKWWLYPFKFIAKCQSKTIKEQYEYGIRVFDLRVSFNEEGNIEFRHGLIAYKGDVYKVIEYLNSTPEKVYVRFILEINSKANLEQQEWLFTLTCERFERDYKNIKFFCGRRKFDWQTVYKFKFKEPKLVQYVSSMMGSKLAKLWPWLYAKLHNKANKAASKDSWVLYDFIEL